MVRAIFHTIRGLLVLAAAALLFLCMAMVHEMAHEASADDNCEIDCRFIGHYTLVNNAEKVAVSGDHAYVIDDDDNLVILDVSDPRAPERKGEYSSNDSLRGIVVSGDYAFLANYDNGFLVINVSDPSAPELEARNSTRNQALDLALSGEFVYVADGNSGLTVFNVSSPSEPTMEGQYDVEGRILGVAVSGDLVFLSGHDNSIMVMDVSDPANPELLGQCNSTGRPNDMAAEDGTVYLADQSVGLLIIDVSDPQNPRWIGEYRTESNAVGVALSGANVFLTLREGGILVFDVSDPSDPRPVGNFDTSGTAMDVAMGGDWAFVTDFDNGLVSLELAPVAWIDEISLEPAQGTGGSGDGGAISVEFRGHGTCRSVRTIQRSVWRSNVGGELHNSTGTADFDLDTLPEGPHEISFRVQDDHGIWSDEVIQLVIVTPRPVAFIDSITPDPGKYSRPTTFSGHGTDDGSIIRYAWRSSMDGEFYNGPEPEMEYSNLSLGNHTIFLKVMDNHGMWSEEVNTTLFVELQEKSSSSKSLSSFCLLFVLIFIAIAALLVLPHLRREILRKRAAGIPLLTRKEKIIAVFSVLIIAAPIVLFALTYSPPEDPIKINSVSLKGTFSSPALQGKLINEDDRNISVSDISFSVYGAPLAGSTSGSLSSIMFEYGLEKIAPGQIVEFYTSIPSFKTSFEAEPDQLHITLTIRYKDDVSDKEEIPVGSYYVYF